MTPRDPIVPNIKPSSDDIALRQRQMQNRRTSSSSSGGGGGSVMGLLGLLIGLAAAGFSGFLYMQLEQTQSQLNKASASQGSAVSELQERLSVTGENASTSLEAQGVMVKENAQEIRKLWDIAYKRNRGDIADNAKAIKDLGKDIAGVRTALEDAKESISGQISALETELSGARDRISSLETSVLALPADTELRLTQNSESIMMAERSLSDLKSSVDKLKKLETSIKQLDNRIEMLHPPVAPAAQ